MLQITLPFLLAILIAYLIYPVVIHFEKTGLQRHVSILFVYLMLSASLTILAVILFPMVLENVSELFNAIPEITAIYQEKVHFLLQFVLHSNFPEDVKVTLISETLSLLKNMENWILQKMKHLILDSISFLPYLFGLIVSLMISYYGIKDADVFKKLLFSLVPGRYRNDAALAGREINEILKNFIQGQLIAAGIVGIIEGILLMLVGVKFPFFLGFIGGIANIIPYFGPILGAIPAVLIGASQSSSVAFRCILVFILVQQLDNAVISPKIIEDKIGLHPLTTIFIVIAGGEFFGIMGMLLAVPVCASLKVVLKRVIERIV